MYVPPSDDRPGCRDTLVISRRVFSIVIPPVAIMLAVLLLVLSTIATFTVSPPWALIPLALLVLLLVLVVRWDRGRPSGDGPR